MSCTVPLKSKLPPLVLCLALFHVYACVQYNTVRGLRVQMSSILPSACSKNLIGETKRLLERLGVQAWDLKKEAPNWHT